MIFVDTSFWVALRNRRDSHNPLALQLFDSHAARGLVTSNHILGETWTCLRRKAGHASAVGFLDAVEHSRTLRVLRVEQKLEEEAVAWLRRHDEREFSFVDATSFALMRASEIREALSFDGDFSAAGFIELRD
ncbi:MAG TPA: type II toxin-antitoxin system VapC family toxin [Thermoanaerobaculia bacterium]|nr:type II toxin-antitoxin system VapC family toxin [Thermoanaerobaculia bacterium]